MELCNSGVACRHRGREVWRYGGSMYVVATEEWRLGDALKDYVGIESQRRAVVMQTLGFGLGRRAADLHVETWKYRVLNVALWKYRVLHHLLECYRRGNVEAWSSGTGGELHMQR